MQEIKKVFLRFLAFIMIFIGIIGTYLLYCACAWREDIFMLVKMINVALLVINIIVLISLVILLINNINKNIKYKNNNYMI